LFYFSNERDPRVVVHGYVYESSQTGRLRFIAGQ